MTTNPESFRACATCGASVPAGQPCVACSLFQVLGEVLTSGVSSVQRFDPMALPSAFGRFDVRREIAMGGMGVVYEAYDPQLRRTVALKMMRSLLLATPEEKARFKTEAGAAAQLDHAAIVPVYEVGEQDGQPYFAMKLIEGGSLAERLKDGPLAVREAAMLMEKLARAVQHAHERGVIHRDLKPGNILLDAAGAPWLTDFGLAKVFAFDTGLTRTQSFLGTLEYMSPEQAAGRTRDIGPASDVWALGAILFQMITARLPFPGEGHTEVLRRIASEEPERIPLTADGVDRDLQTILLRCLEKEIASRMSNAGFLADELERWLAGERIHSLGIPLVGRLARLVRRHPWPIAATIAVVAAGTVVALALNKSPMQTETPDWPPATAFQNGSFEINGGNRSNEAIGWKFSGPIKAVKVGDTEGATDGSFAAIFNGAVHKTGGVLAQTFATVKGQTYTVQFDFGNYGHLSACFQKLQVEVRDGASPTAGAQLIQSGSGQIVSETDGELEQNTDTLIVADRSCAHEADQEFSRVTFTFTAQSTRSTLAFTDESAGDIVSQDGVLDRVTVK